MSQWQPVSRGIDENEPTVVLGDEPTIGVPRLPEHTQVLDVSALQAAHEPPLQAPRGGDAEQEASPSEDDQEVGAHDDPAYALQLSRMQNRRLTDLGLFLLRLSSLALVLEGIHQLMHLGPAIEALRGVPFVDFDGQVREADTTRPQRWQVVTSVAVPAGVEPTLVRVMWDRPGYLRLTIPR